jgi:hypothetical protein
MPKIGCKPGGTVASGYGQAHRAERARQLAALVDGVTPCARCFKPMWRMQQLHLDHDDRDRSRWLGLAHARCNTSAGARIGHARRGHRRRAPVRRTPAPTVEVRCNPCPSRTRSGVTYCDFGKPYRAGRLPCW